MTGWFDVSKEGLARQLARRPKGFVLLELLQNAIDEASSTVEISLTPADRRGHATLVVVDDNPSGFLDLTDAWTLFQDSKKAGDAEKRGRFNSGEKMVLALCEAATIASTTGTVDFRADGTRAFFARAKRDSGTRFEADVRFTREDIAEAERLLRTVLVPANVTVIYNGEKIPSRTAVLSFSTTLATEIDFRPTKRATTVSLYEVAEGETATIYELGIPVVEHDGRWHVDIAQKVPLNSDRDNVTPAYLRSIRTAVLDHAFDLLSREDSNSTWVKDALPQATPEAVRRVVHERFGEKAVAYDPSNPEANKQAVEQGYTLIHGRTLSKDEWSAIRRAGDDLVRPAGQVIQTRIESSADGVPPVPVEDWPDEWRNVARYVAEVGLHLLGRTPNVQIYNSPLAGLAGHSDAWYGGSTISLNVRSLGRRFFEEPDRERIDALLIHEFAHDSFSDHLSARFYSECCRLGAKLRSCAAEVEDDRG